MSIITVAIIFFFIGLALVAWIVPDNGHKHNLILLEIMSDDSNHEEEIKNYKQEIRKHEEETRHYEEKIRNYKQDFKKYLMYQ